VCVGYQHSYYARHRVYPTSRRAHGGFQDDPTVGWNINQQGSLVPRSEHIRVAVNGGHKLAAHLVRI
jgi:hypothetical protein